MLPSTTLGRTRAAWRLLQLPSARWSTPTTTVSTVQLGRFAVHGNPRVVAATRRFSTATTETPAAAPVRDFFLDNLGKIFLGTIAAVILSLVRSSYGTSNQQAVVREIEESAALDPLEIDDLRRANAQVMTPELFRSLWNELGGRGPMTYEEFVRQARIVLRNEKGADAWIQMGFLLDRVVIAALQNGRLQNEDTDDLTMPLAFWLTVLSLALDGPVSERIKVLYELLERTATSNTNQLETDNDKKVTLGDVITMVGYLQETCQLVPEKQVIPTETKYPTQQYRRGGPEELVQWGEAAAAADANAQEVLDLDAFADILRSKSVCAWGECFFKKKTGS